MGFCIGGEQSSKEWSVLEKNPAVKLLDFFQILSDGAEQAIPSGFETTRLVRDSNTASQLSTVKPEWIAMWMKQWKLYL
jgi:hypothetical protein